MSSIGHRPTPPGEILAGHFCDERGIAVGRFAEETAPIARPSAPSA